MANDEISKDEIIENLIRQVLLLQEVARERKEQFDTLMARIESFHLASLGTPDTQRQYPTIEIDGKVGIDFGALIAFPPDDDAEAA
ncbi:hypothetical protein [Devosia submarina]|uniref:hypothetical protein n=1 Tax=Devosia submarina TaxID=1173082 RepID=UPI000D3A717C|nr:hypothetical protein [Devosia submarina]